MKFVTVSPSIPDPSTGGGGNWNDCLIRYLASQGHRVTHVAVIGKHQTVVIDPSVQNKYEKLGVRVRVVPYQNAAARPLSFLRRLRSLIAPAAADLWPNETATRPLVEEIIAEEKPDCVLPFAFDAVLYTDRITNAPRVAVQAEGPHVNTLTALCFNPAVPWWHWRFIPYLITMKCLARAQEKIYAGLCARLTIAAFQGNHYVKWAKRLGIEQARFITTPVPDPAGPSWQKIRESAPKASRCKILLIGHLSSTSNRSGLPLFFETVLPALEKEWGADNFEVHIVGRNDALPAEYDRFRDHPALRFRGPVYPADQEFLGCDVLLVPIPAKTGSRVRIINGFSYGCCIVAHSANALGISELEHETNVLMADSGEGLARLVIRAAKDPALRKRLGENGRRVYETRYTEENGGKQCLELVKEALNRFHRGAA